MLAIDSMILEADAAWRFIHGYKKLLLEIYGENGSRSEEGVVQKFASAGKNLIEQPALLPDAQARLAVRSEVIDPEVFQAVQRMEVKEWLYLRVQVSRFRDEKTDSRRVNSVGGATSNRMVEEASA